MNNFNQPLILKPKPSVQHSMLHTEPEPRTKRNPPAGGSKKRIIGWILILILVAGGFWFFKSYSASSNGLTTAQILDELGEQMILPSGEEPTITTVVNLDEVRYQPFFMNAEVGDQVIVYSKAKKAILYRPSIKKIIEASSLR